MKNNAQNTHEKYILSSFFNNDLKGALYRFTGQQFSIDITSANDNKTDTVLITMHSCLIRNKMLLLHFSISDFYAWMKSINARNEGENYQLFFQSAKCTGPRISLTKTIIGNNNGLRRKMSN